MYHIETTTDCLHPPLLLTSYKVYRNETFVKMFPAKELAEAFVAGTFHALQARGAA